MQLAKIPLKGAAAIASRRLGNGRPMKQLAVVSYIDVLSSSTFGLRLFAMVHQSSIESPDVCRWIDSGRAVEIHSKHGGLKVLLQQYFQRK